MTTLNICLYSSSNHQLLITCSVLQIVLRSLKVLLHMLLFIFLTLHVEKLKPEWIRNLPQTTCLEWSRIQTQGQANKYEWRVIISLSTFHFQFKNIMTFHKSKGILISQNKARPDLRIKHTRLSWTNTASWKTHCTLFIFSSLTYEMAVVLDQHLPPGTQCLLPGI